MILSHFSLKDFTFDPTRAYLQNHFKPRGLWLSDERESGWKDWCEMEEFNLGYLESETHFTFTEDSNILHLATLDEVCAFDLDDKWQDDRYKDHSYIRQIDWGKVAAEYDGFMITPYHRGLFTTAHIPMWYYGWDVPSACVWSLGAIQQVDSRLAEETLKALKELQEPDVWWENEYNRLTKRKDNSNAS